MRSLARPLAFAVVTLAALPALAQDPGQPLAPPPPIAPGPQPAPPPPLSPPPPADPNAPLAPPPPVTPTDPSTGQPADATTAQLDAAEKEDSGRGFELFWLDGKIGGSYIDMRQFSSDTFQIEKASAGGPMFGLGAGIRLVILTLGARLNHHALSSFNMWQINGEIGLKLPIKSVDLLFGVHGGYSFVGRLGDAAVATNTNTPTSTDAVSIRGFNAGLDFALDYYVSSLFSVGAGIYGDFLYLQRPPAALPAGSENLPPDQLAALKNDPLYQQSGTSAGMGLGGNLRLGLHFGL